MQLPPSDTHVDDVHLVFGLSYISLVFDAGSVTYPYYFTVFLIAAVVLLGGIGVLFAALVWLYQYIASYLLKKNE